MEDPTFKLESVVHVQGGLEDFEGPLELILQLLGRNKIEISDIKISKLLDQYLEYLDEMKSMDLDIASEFVAMASHLVYIKTKVLLNADEEVEEFQELIASLEKLQCRAAYIKIKMVTDELAAMYRHGAGLITKMPEPVRESSPYQYVHKASDISAAMLRVLDNGDGEGRIRPPQRLVLPERTVYPVNEKAEEILVKLRSCGIVRVHELFGESRSRTELVATFVALLELCKDGYAWLNSDGAGLVISYTERGAAERKSPENG